MAKSETTKLIFKSAFRLLKSVSRRLFTQGQLTDTLNSEPPIHANKRPTHEGLSLVHSPCGESANHYNGLPWKEVNHHVNPDVIVSTTTSRHVNVINVNKSTSTSGS